MGKKKSKVGSWIVRMKCEVTKEVTCDNCTEEEARNDPWEHATDEHEIDQVDWEVESVKSNE